jgi:hypothetical protein
VLAARRWSAAPPPAWEGIEARVRRDVRAADDFVTIPFPRLASASEDPVTAAAAGYRKEAAVRDPRLSREVTVQERAIPLGDLCAHLRETTGIHLAAGRSIADEKVTLFCKATSLREVMRQLSRPFGYAWLRSAKEGGYQYELAQDLRSQLLEEELRNRDRQEALLDLDRTMQEFRTYLDLSPEEVRRKMSSASPEEKKRLETLAGVGWGLVQIYHRLSPQEIAALRSGRTLTYAGTPGADEQSLPEEIASQVPQSLSHRRIVLSEDGVEWGDAKSHPHGVPPAAVPGLKPSLTLQLVQDEPGQLALTGGAWLALDRPSGGFRLGSNLGRPPETAAALALGVSPSTRRPDNGAANARLARDPALRKRVSLKPRHVCQGGRHGVEADVVTSADLLAALHQATGLPVVGDAYTRLFPVTGVSVGDRPLFEALNTVSDAMGLRWQKEGAWLQVRSATYFNDRLKEVPRATLARLAAARRERGGLGFERVLEIARLSDAQLDAKEMADGARRCWGIAEWEIARYKPLRLHLRFLAALSSDQRREAFQSAGLPFGRLTLPQQQQFIRLALEGSADSLDLGLDALAGATVRVGYRRPGWFHHSGAEGIQAPMPARAARLHAIAEPTRAAALATTRTIDPQITEAEIVTARDPEITVLYTVGGDESPVAQRTVGTQGQGFSTR